MEKLDTVKISTNYSSENQQAFIKRGLADLSSDLITAINAAGKESKGQMIKLSDRIKVLERDL